MKDKDRSRRKAAADRGASPENEASSASGANSRTFLGTESLGRLMARLAVPTIVAQLVNMLYNVVDRIFIGHIPGAAADALTGVGVCFPLIILISSFASFAGNGGGPLASMELGRRDAAEANRILGNAILLLALFAVCLMAGIGLFLEPLLRLFGASDATLPYASQYLGIYLTGTFFGMNALGLNSFLLAQGDSRFALLSMGTGAILNTVLDAAFIFGAGWGVAGAAWATVISQAASAIVTFCMLRRRKSALRPQLALMKPDPSILKKTVSLGSAPFFVTSTDALLVVALNSTLQTFGGDVWVGVMVVLQSFSQMLSAVTSGFTQGVQSIVSYSYGAKLYARARKAAMRIVAVSFLLTGTVAIIVYSFPGFFVGLFSNDSSLTGLLLQTMPVYLMGLSIFGLQSGMQTVFMSLGQGGCSLAVASVRKLVLLIPLALTLPHALGPWGVIIAEPVSDVLSVTFCSLLFRARMNKILPKDRR